MNWFKQHKRLGIFLLAVILFWGWGRYDSRFTPQRWAETDLNHRGKMVKDLLKQYNGLEGMTRTEVEELLGGVSSEHQMAERLDGKQTPMLVYPIGGRHWAVFPEFLFVYLEDGRVTKVQIVAD